MRKDYKASAFAIAVSSPSGCDPAEEFWRKKMCLEVLRKALMLASANPWVKGGASGS